MENVFNFQSLLISEHSTFSRSFFKILKCHIPKWLVARRGICKASAARTVIPSALRLVGLGHTVPLRFNQRRANLRAILLANFSSLLQDYLVRQPPSCNSERCNELPYIPDHTDAMGDDYHSETFRVLKNGELREFGEYRTQRLVLAAWDVLHSREAA